MGEDSKDKGSNTNSISIKKWVGIGIFLLLLGVGFYLYYFYPQPHEGFALISPDLKKELNVLVVGIDDEESVKKGKVEADSIMVVKLKAEDKKLEFKSIPSHYKINDSYLKDMKVEQIAKEIKKIIGYQPEYYFTINYQGFKKVVNELSGIKIKLDDSLKVPDLGLYLKKGTNLLSGKEALNFARWYDYRGDEIDRINRQQQVIKGLINKVLQTNTLLNLPKLYSTVVKTFNAVNTNLDQELIKNVYEFLRNKDQIDIKYDIISQSQ